MKLNHEQTFYVEADLHKSCGPRENMTCCNHCKGCKSNLVKAFELLLLVLLLILHA